MLGGETSHTSPWCRPSHCHAPPILQATVGFSTVSPDVSHLPSSSSSSHSLPSAYSERWELPVGWGRQRLPQAQVQYGQYGGVVERGEASADVEERVRTRQLVENMASTRELLLSDFALPNVPIRSSIQSPSLDPNLPPSPLPTFMSLSVMTSADDAAESGRTQC